MGLVPLALALAAAVVHATWNLLLARSPDVRTASAVGIAIGAVAFAPVLLVDAHVEVAAVPFVVASTALELVYVVLLARAYSRASLTVVYPMARGSAPVLALAIAAYTLVDKHGIRHAAPIAYLELVFGALAVGQLAPLWVRRGTAAVVSALRPATLAASLGFFGSYAPTLLALARAPAAPVAAVRETSVVIAAAIALARGRERGGPVRFAGAALVAGRVAAVALA